MEEADKEKLRELSTDLMALSMRLDGWTTEIKKAQASITVYRNILHNLIEHKNEGDFE